MFAPSSGKSFERALHNSLTADVDPGACGHLSVHRQAKPLEAIELSVTVPLTNEIGIGDENTWRFIVCLELAHRFAGLHEERLVVFELTQQPNNGIESFPASGRTPRSTVNNEPI